MPDRIITAEAVISAKDATGDVFINIARKLGEVGKSAKASAEVERLSKSLSDASKQAEKIGQFRVASKTLDVASLSMAKARQNAAQLAAQIAGMDKPTATLTGKLNQAEREVTRATEAFKRQGQAVRDARGVLDAAGIPLGKLGTEQTRLKGVIEGTTRALEHQIGVERQAAEMSAKVAEAEKREAAARAQAERVAERAAHQRQHDIDHHGIGNYVAGAAAGAVSAHGVMSALERALEAGAERQTTIIGMKNAGMGDAEIQRAVDLATRVSRDAPNLDISQILELHKEARSGVSHPEEAFELMPDLARATSVLKGSGADNANIADIVKGGESLGLMNDPKRFHAYLDAQVRAMKVMGKTITTEQIYEAAKYSKAAGGTLSDDFLNLTMPSLIQEMHGSSAGDALSSLTKTLRGGLQHKHVPVTRLQELGLLEDPSQIRRSKSGEILGYTGKVKGDDLLSTDPDRWFLEYFDKAAESHGYTKLADKTKLLSETLPGTAANLGRIVIQQRESLTNHRQLYRNAPGLEQSVDLQQHDPKVAMQTFTAALNDLEAAVTGPTMDALSLGLGHLSGLFRDLADAAKEHPNIAVGVGAGVAGAGLVASGTLAYYVSTGFGLPSAAAQLEAAALHLQGTGGVPGGGAPGESTKPGASGGGSKSLLGGGGLSGFFGFSATALVQKFLYDQVAGLQDRVLGWTPKNQATLDHATTLSNVVKDVKEQWFGGSADPAAADRDARLRRTERQRLMREPLEGGLDRMRAEMTGENAPLPPPRPMTASGFHPDDDRATRSRASDADVWIQQQDMIRAASQQFGALNDKTGVLQASFTTLDGGSDAAAQQIALLGLAARTVAGAMAGMLSGGGSGGSGSGIISASYEGGGFGGGGSGGSSFGGRVAPNLRRGRPHGIGGSGWSPSPSDPTFARRTGRLWLRLGPTWACRWERRRPISATTFRASACPSSAPPLCLVTPAWSPTSRSMPTTGTSRIATGCFSGTMASAVGAA